MFNMFKPQNDDKFYFELIYKTLTAVKNPKDYFLSIGTVTLSIPESINFDFGITEGNYSREKNGLIKLDACICDHNDDVFMHEYNVLKMYPNQMDYGFFMERLDKLEVNEVYTEFGHCKTEKFVPLILTSLKMVFDKEGKTIDITDKITGECQRLLNV